VKGHHCHGKHYRSGEFARLQAFLLLVLACQLTPRAMAVNVLTQHNDNFRTGANLGEFVLTTSNVNTGQFGKLYSRRLDGQIYAQPLYVHGLTISNKTRNVVYVCTEHNSVYVFDADDATASNALWQVNLGPSVPSTDINCLDLGPEAGITATPVIDLTGGTMYVAAKTKESGNYFHKLHALDLLTGHEKFGGPVVVQGFVLGTGDGSVGGTNTFNALHENNRPGLLLLSNVVYLCYAALCDWPPYHGWLFGYNTTNLQRTCIFNSTPDGSDGGIWLSGMGPAADEKGDIYLTTGNGTFDQDTGGRDFGDSCLKLTPSNGTVNVSSWFAPHNQATLNAQDLDFGSGGPLLLPGTNLFVSIGKSGTICLLDRSKFGGFVNFSSDTNVVQEFQVMTNKQIAGQSLVYWNGPTNQFIFMWCGFRVLNAYKFAGANIQTNPLAATTVAQGKSPGGVSLSANGSLANSAIVWGTHDGNGGTLRAYEAVNVTHELWNSQQNVARDALDSYVKFCAPTIANGKVFVSTGASNLVVYGLLAPPYQLWQQANFSPTELANPAISGDTADPDGDGIPNLTEYAFNMNPKTADVSGLPVMGTSNVGGSDYLTISYKQVLFNTDITCTVQVSSNLTTWSSGTGFTVLVSDVDNGDGTETITVRDTTPISSATNRFIRVHVSRP
jgi:hypothetical protein